MMIISFDTMDIHRGTGPRSTALAAAIRQFACGAGGGVPTISASEQFRQASLLRADGSPTDIGLPVAYHPSTKACLTVANDQGGAGWPARVHDKHRKTLALREGALFRFLVEGTNEVLEAFITDWSPFPAACALAVYPGHPTAGATQSNAFTGKFVRHPLTGDLLPVWTAGWVQPEFGSGVVIVNPAHSAIDLDFARKLGLPIRFALLPDDLTPGTWPVPPVLKTGRATRSLVADGLPSVEAAAVYLEKLIAGGHARRHSHVNASPIPVGRFHPDPGGDLRRSADGILSPITEDQSDRADCGRVEFEPWVQAVLSAAAPRVAVVCPAADAGDHLLAARLLYADAHGRKLTLESLALVQEPAEVPNLPAEQFLIAMLLAQSDQPPSFKKNAVEQADAFIKAHRELSQRWPAGGSTPGDTERKTARIIRAAVFAGNTGGAMAELRAVQKALKAVPPDGVAPPSLSVYHACVAAITGWSAPGWLDTKTILGNVE